MLGQRCICSQKDTYGPKIINTDANYDWKCLHKLRYDWKYFLVMHTAYYIVLFSSLLYKIDLNSCMLVHMVTYWYISFQNALYLWTWLRKFLYCCGWLHIWKCSHIVANWCKYLAIWQDIIGYGCVGLYGYIWLHIY